MGEEAVLHPCQANSYHHRQRKELPAATPSQLLKRLGTISVPTHGDSGIHLDRRVWLIPQSSALWHP